MIDPVAIKKQFILHDRVPNGLPDIMKELLKRNHLATPAQIRSGELFGKNQKEADGKSLIRRVAGGIYSRTFGLVGSYLYGAAEEVEEPESAYVCIEFLNR